MANIKISQLTPKGANLESTDLLEISEFDGSGYVTRSITGQEIIDAVAGSGVTDVTASAPLASSGGSTPDISITQANAVEDGYLSASDWITFNGKQTALVSGTNIKTVEGQSLLGSGNINITATDVGLGNVDNTSDANKPVSTAQQTALNLKQNTLTLTTTGTSGASTLVGSTLNVPQYSGGASGIHAPLVVSGRSVSYMTTSALSLPTSVLSNQRISAMPFIPMVSFTSASFYINVATLQVAAIGRILIYSDSNGLPNTKLYESANLDLSTNGIKTATASFTFNAGTTYWICFHSQGTATLSFLSATSILPIAFGGVAAPTTYFYPTISYAIGSAPTTFGSVNQGNGNAPFIGITSA
jgi:hypothetical protein